MLYQTLKSLVVSLMLLTGITSLTYADFYVIPVVKKMENVVTVAKSGGNYSSLKKALETITDASEENPYVIYIAPGDYTEQGVIGMKSFVNIIGSGKENTIIRSEEAYATFIGANDTTLSNLSIINESPALDTYGVYNVSTSPILRNISITVSGGTNKRVGIYNGTSSMSINNVDITVSGGTAAFGIMNNNVSQIIENSEITVSGASSGNYGIYSSSSNDPSLTFINNEIEVSGGTDAYGVYNYESSPNMSSMSILASSADEHNTGVHNEGASSLPRMTNIIADASGGMSAIGVYNNLASVTMIYVTATGVDGSLWSNGVRNELSNSTTIKYCILNGAGPNSEGLYGGKSVIQSTIINGASSSEGCSLCIDDAGANLDHTCNAGPI